MAALKARFNLNFKGKFTPQRSSVVPFAPRMQCYHQMPVDVHRHSEITSKQAWSKGQERVCPCDYARGALDLVGPGNSYRKIICRGSAQSVYSAAIELCVLAWTVHDVS